MSKRKGHQGSPAQAQIVEEADCDTQAARRLNGALAEKELWRVEEFCRAFGIGKTRAFEMLKRGDVEGVMVGASRRITRSSIETWLANLPRERAEAA